MLYEMGHGLGVGAKSALEQIKKVGLKSKNSAKKLMFIEPDEVVAEMQAQMFVQSVREVVGETMNLAQKKEKAWVLFEQLKSCPTEELLILKLSALALDLGPNKEECLSIVSQFQKEGLEMSAQEVLLREVLFCPRSALLRIWLGLSGGVDRLIWLREKLLQLEGRYVFLKAFEKEVKHLLSDIFAQGLLTHHVINWKSPAAVLENIMNYEQVHKMQSWEELKPRLGADRRIHGFFHSAWENEPVAFIEIALMKEMPANMNSILKGAPIDPKQAQCAVFYSINAPHKGLKGISFGEELIKASAERIEQEFPKIQTFVTLSPIPSFVSWMQEQNDEQLISLVGELPKRLQNIALETLPSSVSYYKMEGKKKIHVLDVRYITQEQYEKQQQPVFEYVLTRLAAKYLMGSLQNARPLDPVARFHLGNGAKVERICFEADQSSNGWEQSRGVMVNYLYELEALHEHQNSLRKGKVSGSFKVRWQAR